MHSFFSLIYSVQSSWAPATGLALFQKLGIDGAQNERVLPHEANILLWLLALVSGHLLPLHTRHSDIQRPHHTWSCPQKQLNHTRLIVPHFS